MMIDFGPNAGILIRRIWIEELPDLRYPVEDVVERTLEAHPKQFGPMRSAAAEMLRPSCGPSSYALIGAKFVSASTGPLHVQVAVSGASAEKLSSPATGEHEVATISYSAKFIGLPREFVRGVLDVAPDAADLLGSGLLRFDHAAHDFVGSSIMAFRWATQATVRLLTLSGGAISEDKLRQLLILDRDQ
jgi:hypothetical protein